MCIRDSSADNTMIAFIRFDESEVPSYSFPIFAGQAPYINALKDYPGEYTYKDVYKRQLATHTKKINSKS